MGKQERVGELAVTGESAKQHAGRDGLTRAVLGANHRQHVEALDLLLLRRCDLRLGLDTTGRNGGGSLCCFRRLRELGELRSTLYLDGGRACAAMPCKGGHGRENVARFGAAQTLSGMEQQHFDGAAAEGILRRGVWRRMD